MDNVNSVPYPWQPAVSASSITVSDTADISTGPTRAIYVGSGGTIVLLMARDSATVTLSGVQTGSVLPFQVKRVYSTGTTASSLIALY